MVLCRPNKHFLSKKMSLKQVSFSDELSKNALYFGEFCKFKFLNLVILGKMSRGDIARSHSKSFAKRYNNTKCLKTVYDGLTIPWHRRRHSKYNFGT